MFLEVLIFIVMILTVIILVLIAMKRDTEKYDECETQKVCDSKCKKEEKTWKDIIEPKLSIMNEKLMVSYDPLYNLYKSKTYNINDFYKTITEFIDKGFGNYKFYRGETSTSTILNIAAFLSQGMAETVIYDVCDENNWSNNTQEFSKESKAKGTPNQYPLSAACGQGGSDYMSDKYSCPEGCPVDPNMTVVGKTHAGWYGAPPPLFCAPSKDTGFWDTQYGWCDPTKKKIPFNDQEYVSAMLNGTDDNCRFYSGQKAGNVNKTTSYNNSENPKSDVTGCCWWGRGVIQLTGTCNIGRLNKTLKDANFFKDGDDLCKNPELICDDKYPTLKWISGLIYWCQNVQNYNQDGFIYTQELEKLSKDFEKDQQKCIDAMKWEKNQFLYSVSGIVNRGCPFPGEKCNPFSTFTESRRLCFFQNILSVIYDLKTPTPLQNCPHG